MHGLELFSTMLFKSPLTLAVLVLVCPALLWAQTDLSHRQNDVTVRVVSLAGDPVAGAAVQIEMLDPVFRFGSAITVDQLTPGHANYSAQAIEALQRNFNSTTFGNYMKWGPFESRPVAESQEMVQRALALRAFNSDVGLRLRGHATLWGASYQVPTDFKNMTDRTQMRTRLLDHIRDYHTAFKDTGIITFDLYNEPFHETELIIDRLIDDPDSFTQHASEVAPWFNRAKEADPNAVLYINDYNIIDFWREDDDNVAAYKSLVDAIRDAGGQVGGIGLQAHIGRMLTREQVTRRLDLLSAPMAPTTNHPDGLPGLEIEITELDINTEFWTAATPTDQATVTANIMDAAFAHPAVVGITMWGMRDSRHWRDNAILYDDSDPDNWVVKPSGQAWLDRVKGTWWTDVAGSTGTSGEFSDTVFKGRHRITVNINGNTTQLVRTLNADETIQLQVDDTPVDTSASFLSNLSVRAPLAVGETLKLGFVVEGGEKEVLARVGGPVLGEFGLGYVPDPALEIRAGEVVKGSNRTWVADDIQTIASTLGAYPFAVGSNDAALIVAVNGPHTSEITGDAAGIVLGEVYDVSPGSSGPQLVNVSALHQTGSGDNVLTAGFYVGGSGKIRLLIRGVGPELTAAYNLPGMLSDPRIRLFRADGTFLQENDDWDAGLASTFDELGAFSLTAGSKDAAMVVLLEAGQGYTVQVVGADGESGKAIVEVYQMD